MQHDSFPKGRGPPVQRNVMETQQMGYTPRPGPKVEDSKRWLAGEALMQENRDDKNSAQSVCKRCKKYSTLSCIST